MRADDVLSLVVQKGPYEILYIGVDINVERRLILIDVTYENRNLNDIVDDVIILLESVALSLNLGIISQIRKLLDGTNRITLWPCGFPESK